VIRLLNVPLSVFHSQVEAGDVILKVNGTDVHRYTTKEGEFSRGGRGIGDVMDKESCE